ncbi:MAG: hypothetical protein E7536_01100 [Ruminococcaceae bacterium]|nr:hypothetical protein [Oscillospiraceae bacterium]
MNKVLKRVIALMLVLAMSVGVMSQVFAAETDSTEISVVNTVEEAKDTLVSDEQVPIIIIHGISQIDTVIMDEEGNPLLDKDGNQITGWPLTVDVTELVMTVIFPVLLTLITQKDFASEAGYKAACNALKYNACDLNGDPVYPTYVDRQYCSVGAMDQEHKDIVYDAVPFQKIGEEIGEEWLYFFSYNSSGDVTQIAEDLNDYIEMVKEQTGAEEVSLAPISMGGTIVTAWLEMFSGRYDMFDANYDSVHKIVFVIAALDGSKILGDIFVDNTLLKNDEFLYTRILPELLKEEWYAYLLNIVLRILPHDVLDSVLDSILAGAKDTLVGNCTIIWALLPHDDFDKAYEIYFKDKGPEYDVIRNKVTFYHTAQLNLQKNINELTSEKYGAIVHAICSYGVPLYPIGSSALYINADGIIHSASTSLFATFADLGKTLPVDYVAKNPVCTDPTHNHISPDRVVDASTSYLPENTWYVQGLNHERTGQSDSVINFAGVLLKDDTITDVHSDPENYPQFNGSRTTRGLRNNDIPNAEKALAEREMTPAQRAELQAALDDCKLMLTETVIDTKDCEERMQRLVNALIDIGVYGAPEEPSPAYDVLRTIFKWLSDTAYKSWGTKGFSELLK